MDAVVDKQVSACGKLWFKENKDEVSIGFTAKFLEEVHKCWHVTPATNKKVEEKSPLLTVETDEALFTVNSPVSGELYHFSNEALNFPDQLQEEHTIAVIGKAPKKVSIKVVPNIGNIDVEDGVEAPREDWLEQARRHLRIERERIAAEQVEAAQRQAQQAQMGPQLGVGQGRINNGGVFINQWFAEAPVPPLNPFVRAPQPDAPAQPRPVNPIRARRPR